MMADMFVDMIKKAIPPEVAELLTAEKMKEIGDKANAFITDLRENMARIEAKQDELLISNGKIINELLAQRIVKDEHCNSGTAEQPGSKPRRNKSTANGAAGGDNG